MSRLIIDISELAHWQGRLTGVPRVMDELSRRFKITDSEVRFVSWDGASGSYHEADLSGEKKLGAGTLKKVARKLLKKPVRATPSVIQPTSGDMLFVLADWHGSDPAFVDYLVSLKKSGVRLAQMAYDLLPIVTPQYSGHATESLTRYTKAVYPICDIIFAISQHTKKDIVAWLKRNKLTAPEIEVIRLGDDFKLAEPKRPADFRGKTGEFLLCVGTIEARKNHSLLYYTYKLAAQQGIELPDLVIVGRRGWKSEDIYEIMTNDPITKQKFIIMEKASDEELSWLYRNCLCSVYPSFYEGWGLPIAESIAHGTPCICSNTSSMPEVGGDLVSYFSPASTDECLRAITAMMKPNTLNQAKSRLEKYQPTSWDETFESVKKRLGALDA
jgi:glycosyltransferase involved in cell wall biosynthesis